MARHRSRHRAVQVLYQADLRGISGEEAIRNYYGSLYSEESEQPPEHDDFMEELVLATLSRREDIDRRIQQYSSHWRVERMPAVDRNIVRLAVNEMIDARLPPAVIIDEAIQLARRFSGEESVPFMNGLLDAIRKDLQAS
jgi:N utilization substance protein B